MYVRACPKCELSYTVGPQVYHDIQLLLGKSFAKVDDDDEVEEDDDDDTLEPVPVMDETGRYGS